MNPWDVQEALEEIQAALGADLLRLKAVVCLDEDPGAAGGAARGPARAASAARLDRWPGPRGSRLIAIARGPQREAVPAAIARHLPQLARFGARAAHAHSA